NLPLAVRGNFTATSTTITRTDGVSWASAGFTQGWQLTLDGAVVGTISAVNGATLTITGGTFGQTSYTDRTVAEYDPKTLATRLGPDLRRQRRQRRRDHPQPLDPVGQRERPRQPRLARRRQRRRLWGHGSERREHRRHL